MKSKIYTIDEIEILKRNPFVVDIENRRAIVYDPIFKLWCVLKKINYPQETCRELFKKASFPIYLMNPKLPQARIKTWQNLFYRYGHKYFLDNKSYTCLKSELLNDVKSNDNNLKKSIFNEVVEMLEMLNENS